MKRVLVACVGNVLRRDDGFGQAVAAELEHLPPSVDVAETGIGGIALLQDLLATPYDGLLIVDALDRGAAPGTVFVLEPDAEEPEAYVPDVHLANPERVVSMARAMGCLPPRVLIVGCQPADVELGRPLTPAVARAVGIATAKVEQIVGEWTGT